MRKLGIIGGLSWVSTELYYRQLQLAVQKVAGAPCSAPLVVESLNFCDLARTATPEGWTHAAGELSAAARRLEVVGATAILIAANSMHKVHAEVAAAVSVPVIHIVDATAREMTRAGVRSAAIIGTRNVMTEAWFRQRMVSHGMTLAPADAGSVAEIDRIIYDELMQGQVTKSAERRLRTIITDIAKSGPDALVLACTELVLLVDADANVLPVFDTTRAHALAGAAWILGDDAVADMSPGAAKARAAE